MPFLPESQDLPDLSGNESRVARRGQGDEHYSVSKLITQVVSDPDCEARLSDPTHTGEGYQPETALHEQVSDLGHFLISAHERLKFIGEALGQNRAVSVWARLAAAAAGMEECLTVIPTEL
jgi:hypothetical protein